MAFLRQHERVDGLVSLCHFDDRNVPVQRPHIIIIRKNLVFRFLINLELRDLITYS